MGATFNRVNGVLVDPWSAQTNDYYADPSLLTGSSNAAAVVPITGSTATYGQLWRGMPVYLNPNTGMLIPPNDPNASSIASTAVYAGVLIDDLTTFALARGTKIAVVRKTRVRSYAGGSLTIGQPVKPDTSANFSGFVAWVDGTDDIQSFVGNAFPLDDGSAENGASAATTMAQGDNIFVNLR